MLAGVPVLDRDVLDLTQRLREADLDDTAEVLEVAYDMARRVVALTIDDREALLRVLEMVSAGEFSGPVVLLSPSFSRKDESIFPRALDRLSRVFGHLPYALMMKLIGPAFGSSLPPARREFLVNELKKNDPRFLRAQTRSYLAYLDRHGSLAKRFCDASVRAWVVFGEKDDIGLAPDEREVLAAAPHVTLIEIADTGHFALNQKPDEIAAIVLQAVTGATG